MEGIQGAVLDVKLRHLNEWTDRRRANAVLYRKCLEEVSDVILPLEMQGTIHVYHLFVIRVLGRDELIKHLVESGIHTGIHYPVPCHLQKAYDFLEVPRPLPVSEKYSEEILSLPMSAELIESEIQYVCEKIKEFYRQ